MTNYAVTDWTSTPGTIVEVAAAIETYLETVTDSKTIRYCSVLPCGGGGTRFVGIIIHDA